MFGIGGDARRYGSLSIVSLGQVEVEESLSAEAVELVLVDAVPVAEVAEGPRLSFPNRVRPFPAWRSSTRS